MRPRLRAAADSHTFMVLPATLCSQPAAPAAGRSAASRRPAAVVPRDVRARVNQGDVEDAIASNPLFNKWVLLAVVQCRLKDLAAGTRCSSARCFRWPAAAASPSAGPQPSYQPAACLCSPCARSAASLWACCETRLRARARSR